MRGFFIFFKLFLNQGAFFNTHNVTCRFALFLTQLFPYIFSLHLHSNEPRQLSIANLFSCSVYLYRLVVDTFSYQGILNEKNILRDNRRYALARRWLQRNADIKDIFQRPFCGVITAHAMYTSAWRRR